MAQIRRIGLSLLLASALSFPALAFAHEAPAAMCDGDKAKDPSAEKAKQQGKDKKEEDKREPRREGQDSDQRS